METTSGPRTGPLSGLRVLDLTTFLSGPYCTQILGDLGADVIKVESPAGDSTRVLPPHFVDGDSAYFLSVNRNKRSVVLDLKSPAGKAAFLHLAGECDAVVENFRAGVLARLGLGYETLRAANPRIVLCSITGFGQDGLGYETLRAANPRIVLCSITGFGQDGPKHDAPAYDAIVQALSGGMSMTGEVGRPPVRAGIPIGDLAAGMFGAIGLLAALHRCRESGEGSHLDVSMLDAQISMLTYQAAYYLVSGQVPGPQGRGHVSIPTYRSFTCGDGRDVIVTANTEGMWQGLCRALDRADLIADPRFADNPSRLANRAALDGELELRFAAGPAATWLERLQANGVPCAPVNTVADALHDPQVRHRNMVVTLAREDGASVEVVGNPVKVADDADGTFRYPPALGEHTGEVLTELAVPADLVGELTGTEMSRA